MSTRVCILRLVWTPLTSKPSADFVCLCTVVTQLRNLANFIRKQLRKQKTLVCFFGNHGVEGVCGRSEMSAGLQGQGAN